MERTRELAEKVGNPRAQSLCYNFLGALEYLQGDWPAALANLRRGIELDREFHAASGEALGWQRLGLLETALGQFDAAHEHLRRGLVVAEEATMRAHCLVRLYTSLAHNRLEAGAFAEAARYLHEGLAAQERHGQCVTCNVLFYPVAAAVNVALGEFTSATRFCELAERAADEYRSSTWIAMARQARGIVALAQGNAIAAAPCFQEAAERFEAIGQHYDAAVAKLHWVEALLSLGTKQDHRFATTLVESARRVLDELGARPALSRANRLIERISGLPTDT